MSPLQDFAEATSESAEFAGALFRTQRQAYQTNVKSVTERMSNQGQKKVNRLIFRGFTALKAAIYEKIKIFLQNMQHFVSVMRLIYEGGWRQACKMPETDDGMPLHMKVFRV